MGLDAAVLARALAEPESVESLNTANWTALLTMARAERLAGTLAWRVGSFAPPPARSILADERDAAEASRTAALWEAEMARRALASLGIVPVLLKGTAFVAAGLSAGQGRQIGDLDLLVPRGRLADVEAALLDAGWEWVKADPYDDAYYRRWMHELPPLIHRHRDRMADVHHTILPPTARRRPNVGALLGAAVSLGNGLAVLSPEDMVIHAALHLFADGDLAGGLRNLWDVDRLLREFETPTWWLRLAERAALHDATGPVRRAARHAAALFGTLVPEEWRRSDTLDPLIRRRLLARDGWGRETRPVTRFAFHVRGHAMRMPAPLLARHLWTKWRKRRDPG